MPELEIGRVSPETAELERSTKETMSFTVRCGGNVDVKRVSIEWRHTVSGGGIAEMNRSAVEDDGTSTWSVAFNAPGGDTVTVRWMSFEGDPTDQPAWQIDDQAPRNHTAPEDGDEAGHTHTFPSGLGFKPGSSKKVNTRSSADTLKGPMQL